MTDDQDAPLQLMSKFWASDSDSDIGSSSSSSEDYESASIWDTPSKATTMECLDSSDPDYAWSQIEASQLFLPLPTTTGGRGDGCTRIVCMSDTHGLHRDVAIPNGNILIHGGDFTKTGEVGTVQDLSRMFHELQSRFDDIVCIAGNHEVTFDGEHYDQVWGIFHKKQKMSTSDARGAVQNCTYLENESYHMNESLVYGSPYTPEFGPWGFAPPRGEPLREQWAKIPTETDVLVTHGPPLGRGDRVVRGGRAGCVDLLQTVQERVQPRLHIFGHIHEGYGCSFDGTTLFVNASNLNYSYKPVNPCIVIDLPNDKMEPARVVQPRCRITSHQKLLGWIKTRTDEFPSLQTGFEENLDRLPLGNQLISEDAFDIIAAELQIHRTYDGAYLELRSALNRIYTEAFE